MNNRKEGILGELDAADYLKNAGYKILERNYKTKFGEADIIADDNKTLVFVEVKSRNSAEFGSPAEAVTIYKQRRYILLAKEYIVAKRLADRDIRFDVIEILSGKINHITNAFEA